MPSASESDFKVTCFMNTLYQAWQGMARQGVVLGCGGRNRTAYLLVMSQPGYQYPAPRCPLSLYSAQLCSLQSFVPDTRTI